MNQFYQIYFIVFCKSISFSAFSLLSMRGFSGSTRVEGETFFGGKVISRCEYFVVNTGVFKIGFFDGLRGPKFLSSWSRAEITNLLANLAFFGGSSSGYFL